MRKIFIVNILLFFTLQSYSQNQTSLELDPYFSALIVADIDVSIDWYSSVLGLKYLVSKDLRSKDLNNPT